MNVNLRLSCVNAAHNATSRCLFSGRQL